MENTASLIHFNKLNNYLELEALISEGECEDIFRECKAPTSPVVNKGVKAHLAKALSGFSNAEGGVLIYGMETQKHSSTGTDIMTSVTRVGNINRFATAIANTIPTLTQPAIIKFEYRVVKQKKSDSAGVIIIHIPRHIRPVQNLSDGKFYFSGGDQFVDAPYSTIERLFLAGEAPNVEVDIAHLKSKIGENNLVEYSFNIILINKSPAVARDVDVFMEVISPSNIKSVNVKSMNDASNINEGRKTYTKGISGVLHYNLGSVFSKVTTEMNKNKRKFSMRVTVYSDKMIPKKFKIDLTLTKSNPKVASIVALNDQ
jgi:hypothetical protein